MRILFYYHKGGGGGLANILLLLRSMARRHPEDTIEIVTASYPAFSPLQNVANIRVRAVRVTGITEIDRFLLGAFLLIRVARKREADVLWSMNLGPYIRSRIPIVLSIHNPHQVYPWRYSTYHPGAWWRLAALRWFFRRSLGVADGVIVQTSVMRDYVSRVRGAPGNICIAPKAVEDESDLAFEALPLSLLTTLKAGLGPTAFTFLYAATWSPHKNHVTLLRAFSELARRNLKVRVVLTVTRDELLTAACEQTQTLIDRGHVVPIGPVDKIHLRSLYGACDACLMPSVMESLSSAHLEAMKWQKPQIAADLSYARDVCGDAALYAAFDDAAAWVQQMERLMGSETVRSELVSAGDARMAHFPTSWDHASETVRGFLDAISQRTGPQAEPNTSAALWQRHG